VAQMNSGFVFTTANTELSGNTCPYSGCTIASNGAPILKFLVGTRITNNQNLAQLSGAVFYMYDAPKVEFKDCEITDNFSYGSAAVGEGLGDGTYTITNVTFARRVPQGSPDIGPATHLRKKGAREEALTATADASDAAANNTRCTSRPVRATSVLP